MKNPVTYFPVPTQHQFEKNREAIRDKPYARYFDGELWIHDDAMPALRAPMDPNDALRRRPPASIRCSSRATTPSRTVSVSSPTARRT